MRLHLSQWKSPGLGAFLALTILLGGLSVLNGVRIVPGPDHPQIALDACHPLQTFNLVSTVTTARSAWSFPSFAPYERGTIPERPRIKINNLNFPPDPPPPQATI
jgi:hypothetical protein